MFLCDYNMKINIILIQNHAIFTLIRVYLKYEIFDNSILILSLIESNFNS